LAAARAPGFEAVLNSHVDHEASVELQIPAIAIWGGLSDAFCSSIG